MGGMVLQINTELDCETGAAFDAMCASDERTKAQQVKWLIKQEAKRREVESALASTGSANECMADQGD